MTLAEFKQKRGMIGNEKSETPRKQEPEATPEKEPELKPVEPELTSVTVSPTEPIPQTAPEAEAAATVQDTEQERTRRGRPPSK